MATNKSLFPIVMASISLAGCATCPPADAPAPIAGVERFEAKPPMVPSLDKRIMKGFKSLAAKSPLDQLGAAELRALRFTEDPPTPCGGKERWPVKVGIDAGASAIDLSDNAQIVDTFDISELNLVTKPDSLPDERISSDDVSEQRLYRIRGYIRFFKLEEATEPNDPNDGDFHVVVGDEADAKYAVGDTGPTGHSFIVEFPHENCVAGRGDKYSKLGESHFLKESATANDLDMSAARSSFEAIVQLIMDDPPTGCKIARCPLPPKRSIPVELIGVVFFDKIHGQIGRAKNGIEIHPVLWIRQSPEPIS